MTRAPLRELSDPGRPTISGGTDAAIDFLSCLVNDELHRRGDRLLERRKKQAAFRDLHKTLDNFDFNFNPKMNRSLAFDLASGAFVAHHDDALFLGRPVLAKVILHRPSDKPSFSRAIACSIARLTSSSRTWPMQPSMELASNRWSCLPRCRCSSSTTSACALPATAAEDLLEIVMCRYEHTSTLLTSNRPVEDWGKLLGDSAAVTAMLDRLLHHGHVLKCGPRSWRTKIGLPPQQPAS